MTKLILAFLLLVQPAWAKTIYVGPSGSNSTPCTTGGSSGTGAQNPASPKRTIGERTPAGVATANGGVSCLVSGDTLIILGTGTYNEQIYHNATIGTVIIPAGTLGNPTIIKGESTTTRATIAVPTIVIYVKEPPAYVRFDSLIIDGDGGPPNDGDCIKLFRQDNVDMTGWQFRNLEIKNCGQNGLWTGPQARNFELSNSVLHDVDDALGGNCNLMYGDGGKGWVIKDNTWYRTGAAPDGLNHSGGIRVGVNNLDPYNKVSEDNIIERNTIYNLGAGIMFNGDRNIMRNNYLRDNYRGIWPWGGQTNSTDNRVFNNTIVRSSEWAIKAGHSGYAESGLQVNNNLLWQNANNISTADWAGSSEARNYTTPDPLFAGTNNVHITNGSQAAGFGLSTSIVLDDFDGEVRPIHTPPAQPVPISAGADQLTPGPSITLTYPSGTLISWQVGSSQTVTWSSVGLTGTITITEDRNNDGSYESAVTSGIANTVNSYAYTVAGSAPSTRKMQVCENDGSPCSQSTNTYAVTSAAGGTLTKRLSGNTGSDLAGAEDTELYQPQPTNNWGNGATMSPSKYGASAHDYLLLRFPALSQIPSTATITSVTLGLFLQGNSSATAYTFDIRRMLRNWLEMQATWNIYSTGNNWTTAGGIGAATDRVSTASAQITGVTSATPAPGLYYTVTDASGTLKTDVQNWVNGSVVNNGWHLEVNGAGEASNYKVFTSTQGTDGQRPYLDVTYTIAAPTITITSPTTGGHYFQGQQVPIGWQSSGISGVVDILVSRDGGFDYETIESGYSIGGSQYPWTVPAGKATSSALFKVVQGSVFGVSPAVRLGGKYRH